MSPRVVPALVTEPIYLQPWRTITVLRCSPSGKQVFFLSDQTTSSSVKDLAGTCQNTTLICVT